MSGSSSSSRHTNLARPRATNTCRECKRRKVRCDRRRPACSRCLDLRPNLACVYDDEPQSYRFVSVEGIATSSSNPSPSDQQSDVRGEHESIAAGRLESIEQRLQQLTEIVQEFRLTQQTSAGVIAIDPDAAASGVAVSSTPRDIGLTHKPSSEALLEPGYLDAQVPGQTRLVSQSFWAFMSEELSELQSLLRFPQPDRQRLRPYTLIETPVFPNHSSRSDLEVGQLKLPSKDICDELFKSYVWNVHPVVPLSHVPPLTLEYERWWDLGPDDAQTQSAPLLRATLFAGAVSSSQKELSDLFGDIDRRIILSNLHLLASGSLERSGFPHTPNMESLAAYMILQGTLMTDEDPLSNCNFIGIVVRVAQMLGLNRDPQQFEHKFTAVEVEVRRRVWWHVYHIDILIAVAAGLPPLIDSNFWSVNKVGEMAEHNVAAVHETQVGLTLPCTPLGIWLRGKLEHTGKSKSLIP